MRPFALLLLLVGCGSDGEEQPDDRGPDTAVKAKAPPPWTPPTPEQLELAGQASAALSRYYELIGRRDWHGAFAMRDRRPGLTYERFIENYERYSEYRATVGVPTRPVEQEGTLWVEIPVQLYGRMRDGSPFGSVGRMTMKRARGARDWKIAG